MTIVCTLGLSGSAVTACDLALALAVDVSGSVDPREYRLQMQGLAEALRDDVISEALVQAQAVVLLVQWTGTSRQAVMAPWTRIETFEDTDALAETIAATPRRWRNFSTAIGEALLFTANQFDEAPDCTRKLIDVSGDGHSNEGVPPGKTHPVLKTRGIVVNALAIEEGVGDLAAYFWENVIRGEGAFVVTADTFDEYPEKIRLKLRREVTRQISVLK